MCSYFCHHMPLSSLCHTWPVPARLGRPHCSTQMSKRCHKTDRYSISPTNKKVCIGIIKGNHSACISSVVSFSYVSNLIIILIQYRKHSGTVHFSPILLHVESYFVPFLTSRFILSFHIHLSSLKFYPIFPYLTL